MSIRMKAIRKRDDIASVDEKDECLYIGFRPSSKDLLIIVQSAPELKAIYMPKSYFKTLSKSMMMMLEMKNIQLKDEGVQNNEKIKSCYILEDDNPKEAGTQDTTEDNDQDQPEEGDKTEDNEKHGNMASTGEGAVPSDE